MRILFTVVILGSCFIMLMEPNIDTHYKIIWYSWFGKRKWFRYGR